MKGACEHQAFLLFHNKALEQLLPRHKREMSPFVAQFPVCLLERACISMLQLKPVEILTLFLISEAGDDARKYFQESSLVVEEVPTLILDCSLLLCLSFGKKVGFNLVLLSFFFPLQIYRQSFCSSTIKMGTIKK